MKVIIAGSRTITDYDTIRRGIFNALWTWRLTYEDVTEVVSGNAKGVDLLGIQWAIKNTKIYRLFPAHWKEDGKKAGYLRNVEMANYADALIAIWDGKSKGTKHMIDIAKKKGLEVYIYKVKNDNS